MWTQDCVTDFTKPNSDVEGYMMPVFTDNMNFIWYSEVTVVDVEHNPRQTGLVFCQKSVEQEPISGMLM
jgi:hypothetical protein